LPHVLIAYEETEFTEKLAPQIIFGGRPANGILPITASPGLTAGRGGHLPGLDRLGYSSPESHGMDSYTLMEIDHIMERAIAKKSTPGGIVLVAKDGQVVMEKAYGFHDYEQSVPVTTETIYDLASITKVLATTQAMMFLESRELIDMDKKVSDYLPLLKSSNKGDLLIKDIMTHESGLLPYIPHYAQTVESGRWKPAYYREIPEMGYSLPV